MTQRKREEQKRERAIRRALVGLIFLEVLVFTSLIFSVLVPSLTYTIAIAGEGNVTVQTFLQVGNVYPEILNITINGGEDTFDLTPNATTVLDFYVIMRDYNGEADLKNLSLVFFDQDSVTYADPDDNNNHYTNSSCAIDLSYGDSFEASANCTLSIEYYANNATWNATGEVYDNNSWSGRNSNIITINPLLAFALPDILDYGIVNSTEVSTEKELNVTNAGNVWLNLSLFGFGAVEGDGNAMNCTYGYLRNISIEYEQYNLTSSNSSSPIDFTSFDSIYKNLTSTPVVNPFNLRYRTNDTDAGVDESNSTYWRIYVPVGVAGNCTGNIVFGAVQYEGV